VNTLIGGDPDETCSSRIGKIRKNSKEGTWTKWVMDKGNVFFVYVMGEEDHWYSAIENDKGYRAVFRLKEEIMEDSVKE
jgi:hypothetical protein